MRTPKLPILTIALIGALFSSGCFKVVPVPSLPIPLTITSLSPNHGPDSTQVTILGTGFSDTAANDAVFFNGKQASLLSVNDTALLAVVPTLAGTGNVIVTVDGQASNGLLFTYDTTWLVTKVIDSLSGPFYIAADNSNNLWLPVYGEGILDKITPQGGVSTIASMYATGVVVDSHNNVDVATSFNGLCYIDQVSPSGGATVIAVDSGFVLGLAVDTAGNLYTANTTTGTVSKITPQGTVTAIATGLFSVSGVAVASDGSVYATNYSGSVYDNSTGVITKISPSGTVTTFANILYSGYSALMFDANNNLYVTVFNQEYALGAVERISPSGVITPLVSANLDFPCGITRDSYGNFYVVQQVDAPGSSVGSVVRLTAH